MPDPKKKSPPPPKYSGELLTKGTVPLTESEKVAAELAKTKTQKGVYKEIPANANVEGINKFQDYLKAKGLVGKKETQGDIGYQKYIQPAIQQFNKENPNIAITPEHISTLQSYHKSVDPRIVVDKRYGPETTQLRYPLPTVSKVETTGMTESGRRQDFGASDKFYTVKNPKLGESGFTGGDVLTIEKSTGKIVDPSKTKSSGEYGYFDYTYNDLVNKGKETSDKTSNITKSIMTGPKDADIQIKSVDPSVYKSNLLSGGGGGTGLTPVISPSLTSNVLPSNAPITEQYGQPKKKGGAILKPPVKKYATGGVTEDSSGGGGIDAAGVINVGAPMVTGLANSLIAHNKGYDVKAMNAAANAGMKDPNRNLVKNQFSNAYNNAYNAQRGMYGTYAKGGLVKYIKGYDEGGTVKAIGAAAPLVGDISSSVINSQTQDEYGRYDTGSKGGDYAAGIGSGALSGAGKGAAAGASLGPAGMAIGAGLGLVTGGIQGGLQAKASRESIEQQKQAEEQARKQADRDRQQIILDKNINEQMSARKTGYGYSLGGQIQKKAMGVNVDNTNTLQSNTPVMNGGYGTFNTPQTDQNPMYYQTRTGYNQPMSQWEDRPKYEEKGFGGGSGGGLSLPKPMFAKGGKITGKGTGTSDSIPAKVKEGSFVVPAKNSDVAQEIRKKILLSPPKKKADLNQKGGESVKLSNGEVLFSPEEVKKIEAEGINLNALAPEAKDKLRTHLNCGGVMKGYKGGGFMQPILTNEGLSQTATPMKNGGNVKKLKPTVYTPTEEEMNLSAPAEEETPAQKLKRQLEAADAASLSRTAQAYEKSNPKPSTTKAKKSINGAGIADAISAAGNIFSGYQMQKFPNQQIALGKEFLAKSGTRPVDQINPEFQSVLNKANQEAKYGFSPQERAALEQQRLDALKSQRDAARYYGLGYTGEREAINSSFGRGLQSAIADKERMAQKQALANDLTATKADMARRLFEDKLNAFKQNQQSGGELLSAGLQNKMDNQRYNNVLTQLQLNRAKESGLFNNFNTSE